MKAYFDQVKSLSSDLGEYALEVRGVVERFQTWATDKPVVACFMNGPNDLRRLFVTTTSTWLAQTSLSVDFGAAPSYRSCAVTSDIRVEFTNDPVSWSFVGTESRSDDSRQPSLDINSTSVPSDQSKLKHLVHTILHEFGHALGLEHEHQSPEAHCDQELNWDAIYKAYAAHGVAPDNVKTNFKALVASDRLRMTPYDQKSIMHYAFAP